MADLQLGDSTKGESQPKAKFKLPGVIRRGPTIERERHRADLAGPSSYGNTLLRIAVIILSSINAVMWEVYTESPFMAAVWAAIVVGFIGWMIYDKSHR